MFRSAEESVRRRRGVTSPDMLWYKWRPRQLLRTTTHVERRELRA